MSVNSRVFETMFLQRIANVIIDQYYENSHYYTQQLQA